MYASNCWFENFISFTLNFWEKKYLWGSSVYMRVSPRVKYDGTTYSSAKGPNIDPPFPFSPLTEKGTKRLEWPDSP